MLSLWILSFTHVPTYGNCRENCCTPPRPHTTSQVLYLKGPGGLEVHIKDEKTPFNILQNEIIDVDAVFRDKIDPSTFNIYIGCGGCVASEDPLIQESRINITGYQPGEVEPFTQTSYYSLFKKEDRKFNSNLLNFSICHEKHFTIRLVDLLSNRSEPIVWAPVIGLAEKFTFIELIEFPIYILKNHGNTWNNLEYTYWIWLFIGTPPLILNIFCYRAKIINPREVFYEIALIGFMAAGFEELTHLIYVQIGIEVSYGLYVGLAVILFSQGIGILFTIIVWRSVYHNNWCSASPYWAPLEILTGFSFLFLFGAGFFVGPSAIMIAGIFRLRELCPKNTKEEQLPQIVQKTRRKVKVVNRMHHSKNLGFIT